MKRISALLLLVVVVLSGCLAPLTPVPPGPPALPPLPTVQRTPATPAATPLAGTGTVVAPPAGPTPAGPIVIGPTPTGGPQATGSPGGSAPVEQPVVFPPGTDTVTFQSKLGAGGSDLYRLTGQAGQTVGVHLDAPAGQMAFGVMGVNGTMLSEYTGAPDWTGVLTTTQQYLVDVHNFGGGQTAYSVRISLTPQPTPAPTQAPPTTLPTEAPPTLAPTQAPPTLAPTQAPPTPAPTLAPPPTLPPTQAPPTPAPTLAPPPTLPPTQAPPTLAPTLAPLPTLPPTQAPPTPAPTLAPPPTLAPTQPPPTPAPTLAPPTPTRTPTLAPSPAPPTPTPAPPSPTIQRITLAPGATSATVHGRVAVGGVERWVIKGDAGQTMSVQQNGSRLVLAIWGADGTVLLSQMAGATSWSGVLPTTQDYNIDVIGPSSGAANYSLTVSMPSISTPAPVSTPGPAANRISLAPGAISATVSGTAGPGTERWVIAAGAEQTMIVQLSPAGGQVVLAITGADGTVLISSDAGATSWSGALPATQDYYIEVLPGSFPSTPYSLTVTIPPG